jgi:glutaredoxin
MKTTHTFASLLLCAFAISASSQTLYKWVDAQGNISYSDQPPPPSMQVKDLSNTVNTLGAGQSQNEALPFELAQLAAKSPVVIYTSKGCGPCDLGRRLLRSKNVPFTEKTVSSNADLKTLGTQFNAQTLPVLAVGTKSVNGFGSSQWSDALLEGGYNELDALPKSYTNGASSPLTEPQATAKPIAAKAAGDDGATPTTARRRTIAPTPPPAPEPVVKFQK